MKKIALFYLLIFAGMGSFLSAHAYEANETQFIGQIRFEEDFSTLLDKEEKVVELSVGVDFTGVLTSNGRVFMWGKNNFGQLGNATTVNSSIPIDITSRFNLDETDRIIQLVLSRDFAGALSDTGRVFMWGANGSSQLGRGNDTRSNIPIEITNSFNLSDDKIIQLEVGDSFAGSISQKREVFTWGSNASGQLGDDTTWQKSLPVKITSRFNFQANETINFFNLGSESVSLITSDRIFVWGKNNYGQLGLGHTTMMRTPIDLSARFTNLESTESVLKVIIGNEHTIALTSEGKVYTWGRNDEGQIGNNSSGPYTQMLNLLLIPFDETIVDVGVSDKSSFALTSSGLLYVWGLNTDNNISTTSTRNFLVPTEYDYDFNQETGKTVKYFDTSGRNSGLIASDDTIYMFGYNDFGQIGNQNTTNQSSPVLITSFEIKVNTDITFDSNGGTLVNKISQITGAVIVEPNEPAKDGYTFIGWFSDEALTEAYTFVTMPANDLTLYAKWTINPYTMSFDSNEGSAVADITQDYNTNVSAPTDPTLTGYTFDGWYSDAGLTTAYTFTTMPAEDITLYAKWTINPYTITFNSNGGSAVADITQDYNTNVSAPTEPTLTGYTFDGWYSDAGLTTAYTFTTMPAEDITLYTTWELIEYEVSYELDGGTNHPNNPSNYNIFDVFYFAYPTKENLTFDGWYLDLNDLDSKVTFRTLETNSNVILYAKWSSIPIITFNPNNNTDSFDTDAVDSYVIQNKNLYITNSTSKVMHNLFNTEDLYVITINSNSTDIFATNISTGNSFQLGTLPSGGTLQHIQVIDGKIYGFVTSNLSFDVRLQVFEINHTSETSITTSLATTEVLIPKASTDNGTNDIEVVDFNNNGTFDIFIKWNSSKVGSSNNTYKIISYTFNHNLATPTLTKNMDYNMESVNVADYTFYDLNGDGNKEMIISLITTSSYLSQIRIYQHDEINNRFDTLLKTFTIEGNSRIITNGGLGGLIQVGKFLGGNTNYIAYINDNRDSTFTRIKVNFFKIDDELNAVGDIHASTGSILAPVGTYRMDFIQINTSGEHAFLFQGATNVSNARAVIYSLLIPNADKNGYVSESSGNIQLQSQSGTALFAQSGGFYFNNNAYFYRTNTVIANQFETFQVFSGTTFPIQDVIRNGYTFNGWFQTDDFQLNTNITAGTRIFEDTEVYAKWNPNNYSISFNSSGGSSVSTLQIQYDSIPSKPTDPTRTHFQFLGWSSINDQSNREFFDFEATYTTANNTTLFAIWENEAYTVKHETNSEDVIVDYEANSLSTYVLPNNLLKTGHDFGGWYTTSDFSGSAITQLSLNQTETTVYAKWLIQLFIIEFKLPNGDVYDTLTYTFGANISDYLEPAINPSVDGAVFLGWETTSLSSMPAEDISLNMLFDAIAYTVYFSVNEGVAMDQLVFDYASTIILNDATRLGYTFSGWFSDALLTNEFTLTTMPANDVTLYAKWTINEYTVTFDSNEGSSVAAITQDYATTVTAPTPPTRTGYTFNGWFSDDALTAAYTFDTMPASNTTLYAKWTINEYTVTFDSNEGSAVTAITQDYATTVIAPTPPTRTGYTFNGWFSDDALTAAYTFDTMPASNTTLYAKWDIITYTITFELNEGTLGVNQVTTYTVVSDPVVLLEATKDGHVFQGYYLEATFETLVSTVLPTEVSNLTVYALFYTTAFDTYLEEVNDLPNPLSIEDKETIESYLNTYDTFSTFEQGYVDRSLLVDALDTIITLEVERVKDAIDALSDPVSLSDEADLEIARALYEALTPEQQAEITNVTVLETREDTLEVLKVETLITLIPQPINTQSEEEINEAKEAFDALTNDLQDDVSNEALLNELLTILKIVKDMETLLSETEPTEEQLIPIQEQLQSLTEEQLGLIDETVYSDYLLLEEELTATSSWFFLGGGFSLLFLLLGYFYYRYQKEKQQA
jgi:uncharacterized repeat protein (TIGR02543 family)